MYTRILRLSFALVAALLVATACAHAAAQYAVAAGTRSIYMLSTQSDWDGRNYKSLVTADWSASFTGIAVKENLVFAADVASNSLCIYRVTHTGNIPTGATLVKKVSLAGSGGLTIMNPDQVVVDATGGVYVLGTQYSDNDQLRFTYAYVKPSSTQGWNDPTVTITDMPDSPLAAIAPYGAGAGALIAHQYIGGDPDPASEAGSTYITKVDGATAGATKLLDQGRPEYLNHFPQALVTTSEFGAGGYAYVINRTATSIPGGSLSVFNIASMSLQGNTIVLPDSLVPQDISVFSSKGKDYLAIVGQAGSGMGSQKAWRIELDGSGIPNMASLKEITFVTQLSQTHYLASDGEVTWITSPDSNTILALDNASSIWSQITGISVADVNESIRRINTYTVPEPSSLAALCALGGALLVGWKRKRA